MEFDILLSQLIVIVEGVKSKSISCGVLHDKRLVNDISDIDVQPFSSYATILIL